jgi:hypothetical protein
MKLSKRHLWTSEHQRLEFKEAKNSFDRRGLNEYCVAIANEGGGNLVLGGRNHRQQRKEARTCPMRTNAIWPS